MTNNQPIKCVPDGQTYKFNPMRGDASIQLKCATCNRFWLLDDDVPTCHPVEIQGEEKCKDPRPHIGCSDACFSSPLPKEGEHGNKGNFMNTDRPSDQKVIHSSPLPKEREGWIERFREKSKGKVVSHLFDGSCCYNDNEGGKGHKECRYPYNPGMENPTGEQCLKLREEHFDIKSFIAEEIEKAVDEGFKKGLEKGWREAKRLYDRN